MFAKRRPSKKTESDLMNILPFIEVDHLEFWLPVEPGRRDLWQASRHSDV